MPEQRGNNEGFRVQEEFVCQAIPGSALSGFVPLANLAISGTRQGMRLLDEIAAQAGPFESVGAALSRKENLPRLLLASVLYARSLELGKSAPVLPGDLDLKDPSGEAILWVIARYTMARDLDLSRPSHVRRTFLLDLALMMAEIARPQGIFVGEAKRTGMEVAVRLLRREGWAPAQSSLSEWESEVIAVDPANPRAAREYLRLLRGYWGWTGESTDAGLDERELLKRVAIPDSLWSELSKRCV